MIHFKTLPSRLAILATLILPTLVSANTRVQSDEQNKSSLVKLRQGTLSEDLCADARDGVLDNYSLLEAALIAGGVNRDADLFRCRQVYNKLRDQVLSNAQPDNGGLNGPSNSHARAAALLANLHRVFLTGQYDEHLHRLDECLTTGNYNCLTSTILLVCLAEECDLPIVGVARTGHVFAQYQSSPPLRIESTDPNGCQNPLEPLLIASGEEERPITAAELIAKVYYNRAVEMLRFHQFESALEMLSAAELLDPKDQLARQNRLAAYNNWALESCQAYRFEQANTLVQQGLAISPNYPLLRQNETYIYRNWAENLSKQGRFSEALAVAEKYNSRRASAELRPLQNQLAELWVAELRRSGQHTQADTVAAKVDSVRSRMPLVSHPSN